MSPPDFKAMLRSVRRFLVDRKERTSAEQTAPSDSQSLGVQIETAIGVFADRPQRDDDEAVRALLDLGVPRIRAEKMVVLVPLAFARVLLSHSGIVNFANEVVVAGTDQREHRRDLRKEPLHQEAVRRAMLMYHDGPNEKFEATCQRSAELSAVTAAVRSGNPLESLKSATFSPTRIIRLSVDEWDAEMSFP